MFGAWPTTPCLTASSTVDTSSSVTPSRLQRHPRYREDTHEVDYWFPKNDDGMNEWRVRSGPSQKSPVVAKLKTNQKFVVTHEEPPWIRVRVGDVVGWTRPEMKNKRYLHRQATQSKRTLPRLYFSWRNGTVEYVCCHSLACLRFFPINDRCMPL